MPGIKELTALIKELDGLVSACTRCGACQGVCPLFGQTGREADVARGKLALLEGLAGDMFKDPAGVSDRLGRCLLCGSCEQNCASGVNALEIFMKARSILAGYMGLSRAKKILLRHVLARPALFDRIMEMASTCQFLFIKPADKHMETSCGRLVSPLIAERRIKPLAPVPFHKIEPSINTGPGASGRTAAFFTGCLIDKVFPDIARDAIHVLDYHRIGVFMPEGQGCCGMPAICSGDTAAFNRLVMHNLELFETGQADYLVTACSTCAFAIRKLWPMMAGPDAEDVRQRIAGLSEKTMDISTFLVQEGIIRRGGPECPPDKAEGHTHSAERKAKGGPEPVTYHDPCHLRKSMGVSEAPRELIKEGPLYKLQEMRGPDRCCGMGGSFNLAHYDISSDIGSRKADDIQETGCSMVATACPACMVQLSDMLSRAGIRTPVRHVISLYAETLKNT